MKRRIWLGMVLVAGCHSKGDDASKDTAWWDVGPAQGSDASEGGGEYDDDDEEPEEGEFFWGELELSGGTPSDGAAGYYAADEDGELCEIEYGVVDVSAASGCAECEQAWTLTLGEEERFADEEGACDASGWGGLGGTAVSVGYAGEALYVESEGAWSGAGYSEVEGDAWYFEVFVEDRED